MAIKTYKDGTPFTGVIGRTTEESSPAWPEPPRPPEGAPNVLFVVLDDVGYGQLSSFGGLVETPVMDSLAANGLRYTNVHTTALCSPSRSCIMTGRNHHSMGLGTIAETSTGYPGYNAILPFTRTGEVSVQTRGFAGSSCRQASAFLEKALGKVARDRATAEMYQTQPARRQNTTRS